MKYLLAGTETERILFRAIRTSDYPAWLPFFEDPTSFSHWQSARQTPEKECRFWFEKQHWRYTHNMGGMNALEEKSSGALIGFSGLLIQTVDSSTEVEIAYSLLGPYRSKGFATEAATACRNAAFTHNFTESLISIISLSNKASENVALKVGMTSEKQTIYNYNNVNIFRITKNAYLQKITPSVALKN